MSRVCKIARRPAKRARSYFCAGNCCISREDEVPHPLLCIFKITKTNFGVTILLHIFVASSFSHTSWFVFVDLHGPVWTEKKKAKSEVDTWTHVAPAPWCGQPPTHAQSHITWTDVKQHGSCYGNTIFFLSLMD